MRPEELEGLPVFVWVRNPKGLLVEVRKNDLPDLLKKGFVLVTESAMQKEIQFVPPQSQLGQKRVYLDVEEV